MPESLIREKIAEALVATGNNRHDALKLLLTWAVRDPSLLLAMTRPHLKGIAAGHIDHYLRHAKGKKTEDNSSDKISRTAIDDIVSSARSSDRRRGGASIPPPKSTERQASTMRKLAAAFTRKNKE